MQYFEDENLNINHSRSGLIAMANRGPNTNGCQFYITTMPAPWLNGKHTIFGKVIDGQGAVHKVEQQKTDSDDFPVPKIIVEDCGDFPMTDTYTVSDDPYEWAIWMSVKWVSCLNFALCYSLWAWIKAAYLPLGMSFGILALFQYIIRKLDIYS